MVLVWGWFSWFALAICTNVQSPVKKLFSENPGHPSFGKGLKGPNQFWTSLIPLLC